MITMTLLRTMLNFHCEDVHFQMVLRYLIPLNHLIKQKWQVLDPTTRSGNPNQNLQEVSESSYTSCDHTATTTHSRKISVVTNYNRKMNEDFSSSAEQFLKISLGIYSEENDYIYSQSSHKRDMLERRRTSQSPAVLNNLDKYRLASPFHSYLQSAALVVNQRILATHQWQYSYDGVASPPPELQLLLLDSRISGRLDDDSSTSSNVWARWALLLPNQQLGGATPALTLDNEAHNSTETVVIDDEDQEEAGDQYAATATTPTAAHRPDVGYYSHNGSGSTVNSKVAVPPVVAKISGPRPLTTDAKRKSSRLNKNWSSSHSIYKLHYRAQHLSYGDDDDDDDDNDADIEVDDDFRRPRESPVDQSHHPDMAPVSIELLQDGSLSGNVTLQSVLLSTSEHSDLAEFVTSLSLLRLEAGSSARKTAHEWTLDWDSDQFVTEILLQHGLEPVIISDEEEADYEDVETSRAYCDLDSVNRGQLLHSGQSCLPIANMSRFGLSCQSSDSNQHSTPTNEAVFKHRLQSFDNSLYSSPAHTSLSINLGPFLNGMLQRLSLLASNNFFLNLHITGIIADLAAYPHPLLKTLLLDVDVILQPHIAKLYEILSEVRQKLLDHAANIANWETILESAYEYLYYRINLTTAGSSSRSTSCSRRNSAAVVFEEVEEFQMVVVTGDNGGSINSKPGDFFSRRFSAAAPDKKSRRTPFGILHRRKKTTVPQYKFPVSRFSYSKKQQITEYEAQRIRNLAYNWILFDEFCKELASLCQEHTQHCFF